MAEPLNYFNPKRMEPPDHVDRQDRPTFAMPVEFDVVLTATSDHAAARAVEAELCRQHVPFFRTEGGDRVNRVVELRVRSADRLRASQAAGMIFARRRRLDQLSPRRPPPRYDSLRDITIGGLMFP